MLHLATAQPQQAASEAQAAAMAMTPAPLMLDLIRTWSQGELCCDRN